MKNVTIFGAVVPRQEGKPLPPQQDQPNRRPAVPQRVHGTPAVVADFSRHPQSPATIATPTDAAPGAIAGTVPGTANPIPGAPASITPGAAGIVPGTPTAAPGAAEVIPGAAAGIIPEVEGDKVPTPAEAKKDADLSMIERMIEAQKKAKEQKDRWKLPKRTNYGDLPIEAYARLSRARRQGDVAAAAGYARRQIAQLQAAKRQDPDSAPQIQAAINQLQKAVTRAGRKKRELQKEEFADIRRKRLESSRQMKKARLLKLELKKRQRLRTIREHGYIREAEIDQRFQAEMAATRAEYRAQLESLAGSTDSGAVRAQYEAQLAADGAAPVPAADLNLEA